jgi:hypothetical protein
MAGDRQLLHKMLSPIGHSQKVPNLLMELQFPVTNEVLMEPESGLNFQAFRTGIWRVCTEEGTFRCCGIPRMHSEEPRKCCAAERRANSEVPVIRTASRNRSAGFPTRCRLAEPAPDLVAHVLAESLPARGAILLVDIEAVEDVEVFEDRISIACHRQYAKQLGRRPAGAFDFPFAYRVGAVARRKAAQLCHVGSRQASADRMTEILANLFQLRAGHSS